MKGHSADKPIRISWRSSRAKEYVQSSRAVAKQTDYESLLGPTSPPQHVNPVTVYIELASKLYVRRLHKPFGPSD